MQRLQRLGSGNWDLSSVKLIATDFSAMKQSLKEATGRAEATQIDEGLAQKVERLLAVQKASEETKRLLEVHAKQCQALADTERALQLQLGQVAAHETTPALGELYGSAATSFKGLSTGHELVVSEVRKFESVLDNYLRNAMQDTIATYGKLKRQRLEYDTLAAKATEAESKDQTVPKHHDAAEALLLRKRAAEQEYQAICLAMNKKVDLVLSYRMRLFPAKLVELLRGIKAGSALKNTSAIDEVCARLELWENDNAGSLLDDVVSEPIPPPPCDGASASVDVAACQNLN